MTWSLQECSICITQDDINRWNIGLSNRFMLVNRCVMERVVPGCHVFSLLNTTWSGSTVVWPDYKLAALSFIAGGCGNREIEETHWGELHSFNNESPMMSLVKYSGNSRTLYYLISGDKR